MLRAAVCNLSALCPRLHPPATNPILSSLLVILAYILYPHTCTTYLPTYLPTKDQSRVLLPSRALRKLEVDPSYLVGLRERDRPSPGRATSRASCHGTLLLHTLLCSTLSCNTPSTQQTQHTVAPLHPPPLRDLLRPPPRTAFAALRPSTPNLVCRCSISASLPALDRSLPPPSLARAS